MERIGGAHGMDHTRNHWIVVAVAGALTLASSGHTVQADSLKRIIVPAQAGGHPFGKWDGFLHGSF
jgi:hypothetical protein